MSKLTRPTRRLLILLAGCCLFAIAACGTAAADSLVFIKDNNVWLSNPDGSGQFQVTTDGSADNPYQSPSQADDGTIVAACKQPNGGPLYRMKQNGELLGTVPTGPMLAGPFEPQVSPDGQTVAYEHVFSKVINGYLETSSDVRFTKTDGSTPNGFAEVGRGAGYPSWVDSGRAFVGINATTTTVVPGQAPVDWWSDYDHQPVYFSNGESIEDGEVAPNGNIAVVRGEMENNTIQLYRSTGGFTSLPTPTCTLKDPSPGPAGQRFADPTFSPSGDAIAWQEGNGIWSETLGADCAQAQPKLLIAGASEPDWGPAPVNPEPRIEQPAVKSCSGPGGGLTARARTASLRKALSKGIEVRVCVPSAGRLAGVSRLGGEKLAAGSRRVAKAGAATLVLRFSKAVRRELVRVERVKLGVQMSFRPAGGGKRLSKRLTVRLKG